MNTKDETNKEMEVKVIQNKINNITQDLEEYINKTCSNYLFKNKEYQK